MKQYLVLCMFVSVAIYAAEHSIESENLTAASASSAEAVSADSCVHNGNSVFIKLQMQSDIPTSLEDLKRKLVWDLCLKLKSDFTNKQATDKVEAFFKKRSKLHSTHGREIGCIIVRRLITY